MKRFKYKKKKKITLKYYGFFAIQALSSTLVNHKSLESCRRLFLKFSKRKLMVWINILFNIKIRKKALGMRMGKGIGTINKYLGAINKFQIFFEFSFSDTKFNTIIDLLFNKLKFRLNSVKLRLLQ